MALNMEKEVDAMERMTTDQLRKKYEEVFGEPTNARHKTWLIKRIAWRMQSNEEGGLSERALKRAAEIVNESDIRMSPPRRNNVSDEQQKRTKVVSAKIEANSELLPSVVLQRDYKGRKIRVTVLDDGFVEADGLFEVCVQGTDILLDRIPADEQGRRQRRGRRGAHPRWRHDHDGRLRAVRYS